MRLALRRSRNVTVLSRSAAVMLFLLPHLAAAQSSAAGQRVLEFRFTPTARTQIAFWIEKPDGTFLRTLYLTQAVGFRGIGNRPGASEMNSGFHWPYGRREGALPVWAHRRASALGASQFKRVIFQNRASEGDASRTSDDESIEQYFCLSFMADYSAKGALDAVSCASRFNSDKGRFITSNDVNAGYSEPTDSGNRPLDMVSLYPPRRDVTRCTDSQGCNDTADIAMYGDQARQVMPEIDSVTMATPPGGDVEQSFLVAVPSDLADGDYVVWAEVNTEGDSNSSFTFSTPTGPGWDSWAESYGYSYRGQPSVAFQVPVTIGQQGTFSAKEPAGYGSVEGFGSDGGTLHPMDSKITDDPSGAPGSGADRFRLIDGHDYRLQITVRGGSGTGQGGAGGTSGGTGGVSGAGGTTADPCTVASDPPAAPANVKITDVTDPRHSHEWGHLHFTVPESALPIHDYDVRVSVNPITSSDQTTFDLAPRANVASLEDGMLIVPTTGSPGANVDVDFGHLLPLTTYYVAVRANNICAVSGQYVAGSFMTSKINFTKLSGCFVATAAYGSALSSEVESLRVARDALRRRSEVAATVTDLYYRSGPVAAAVISRSDATRAVVRTLLAPLVDIAAAAETASGNSR